jgi:hypothetical protein
VLVEDVEQGLGGLTASGGGFAGVDVSDDDDVDMSLLFTVIKCQFMGRYNEIQVN